MKKFIKSSNDKFFRRNIRDNHYNNDEKTISILKIEMITTTPPIRIEKNFEKCQQTRKTCRTLRVTIVIKRIIIRIRVSKRDANDKLIRLGR